MLQIWFINQLLGTGYFSDILVENKQKEIITLEVCFIQTRVALNAVLLFLKSCSYFKFPNKIANAPRQGRPHLLSLWVPLRMCMVSLQDDTKCWLLLEEFPAVPAKMVTSVTLSTGYHDGLISYVSLTGPQVHRYLVKPYSGSICEGFWMRLTFESTEWVKQTALSNVGGPHQISWRTEQSKKAE